MELSKEYFDLIRESEGFKNKVYLDTGKMPTIGMGHLLTQSELRSGKINIMGRLVRYADGLSDEDIKYLMEQDTKFATRAIRDLVRVELTQNQYNVLTSFVFNVGVEAFRNSTLLKKLNAKQYGDVPHELNRWVYDNGKQISGLVDRRKKEAKLWKTP